MCANIDYARLGYVVTVAYRTTRAHSTAALLALLEPTIAGISFVYFLLCACACACALCATMIIIVYMYAWNECEDLHLRILGYA
jgi:uncharacterized membrane protein